MMNEVDNYYPNIKKVQIRTLLKLTTLSLKTVDYVDFRYYADIENSMENIIFWQDGKKIEIIYTHLDRDGELSHRQFILNEDKKNKYSIWIQM
ncbi:MULTISPECIES: hypothetical protein [unclassified Acinetobacter]|uniref:hypothetical protein n=1 Tax=unclassified Acinetobacter TaxID=196816 RepID=UPI0035B9BBFF